MPDFKHRVLFRFARSEFNILHASLKSPALAPPASRRFQAQHPAKRTQASFPFSNPRVCLPPGGYRNSAEPCSFSSFLKVVVAIRIPQSGVKRKVFAGKHIFHAMRNLMNAPTPPPPKRGICPSTASSFPLLGGVGVGKNACSTGGTSTNCALRIFLHKKGYFFLDAYL